MEKHSWKQWSQRPLNRALVLGAALILAGSLYGVITTYPAYRLLARPASSPLVSPYGNKLAPDTLTIEEALARMNQQYHQAPQRALAYAERAREAAQRSRNLPLWAEALYHHAWLSLRAQRHSEVVSLALSEAQICHRLASQLDDSLLMGRSHALIATILFFLGEPEASHRHLHQMHGLIASHQPLNASWKPLEAERQSILGLLQGTSRKAITHYQAAQQLFEESQAGWQVARMQLNLAVVHGDLGNAGQANSLFKTALNHYQQHDFPLDAADAQLAYGRFLAGSALHESDPGLGMEQARQAISHLHSAFDQKQHARCEVVKNLNLAYYAAYLHGDEAAWQPLGKWVRKSLTLATEEEDLECLNDLLDDLMYYGQSFQERETLINQAATQYTQLVQVLKQRLGGAQKQVFAFELGQWHRRIQRFLQQLLLGAGALLLLLGVGGWGYHQHQRVQQLEMRMQALQSQMNPHFISNGLNAIEYLVLRNQRKAAAESLVKFSNLCRQILDGARLQAISLQDELELLEDYLSIEQLRLPEGQLSFELAVDDQVDKRNWFLPCMMVQPFVENAVWHGIQHKATPGNVRISFCPLDEQWLQCVIEDDGIGRARARALAAQSKYRRKTSWSTQIVKDRLAAYATRQVEVVKIADVQAADGSPAGTRVSLRLPRLPAPNLKKPAP